MQGTVSKCTCTKRKSLLWIGSFSSVSSAETYSIILLKSWWGYDSCLYGCIDEMN